MKGKMAGKVMAGVLIATIINAYSVHAAEVEADVKTQTEEGTSAAAEANESIAGEESEGSYEDAVLSIPDDTEKEAAAETNEAGESNEDKENCIGIDGLEEPDEMIQYSRASTIPGKWIQASDGRWWYRHNNGTYTKNGWEYINNAWYYFDAAGWMMTGWIQVGGKWYYLNPSGAMVTGWVLVNGKWYYCNTSGAMQTGWLLLSGKWYYCDASGAMQTDWQLIGGEWYYFSGDGVMATKSWTDKIDDNSSRTIHIASSGAWMYTVSLNSFNLVDALKHLDWGGSTKYASYVTSAANIWNAHKPGVIRKDTAVTVRDVTIEDYYYVNDEWGYTTRGGKIGLNRYYMDKGSDNDKINTVMHELGHALGLGHNDKGDVMAVEHNNRITLTKSDEMSYDEAYRQY